jgi:GDSL-like Lipase/Acylhydrolase family
MATDGRAITRRRLLVAGAAGAAAAGATTVAVLRRRRGRRDPFAGFVTLRTDSRAGPRGAVAVVGDSLTFERLSDLVDRLRAAGFGPVRVDGRPGRRCVQEVAMSTSGLQAVRSAADAVDPRWWVLALGTNDLPDSPPDGIAPLVERVLAATGTTPVVWVNLWVLGDASSSAAAFNAGVAAACGARPATTVADWAAAAGPHPEWFMADGLHNTPEGALARNAFVVDRLVAVADASP